MDMQCRKGAHKILFPAQESCEPSERTLHPLCLDLPQNHLKRNLDRAKVAQPKIAIFKKKSFQSLNSIYLLDSPSLMSSKTFQ